MKSPATLNSMHEQILKRFELEPTIEPVGQGIEAKVYQLDQTRVLKIYNARNPNTQEKIEVYKSFYDGLRRDNVDFEVPSILEVGNHDDTIYSIDRLLTGKDLKTAFKDFDEATKLKALDNYIDAASQIRLLTPQLSYFGEILASNAIREDTWLNFLQKKMATSCKLGRETLEADFPDIKEVVGFMQTEAEIVADTTDPELVHGDFYTSNVLVNNEGTITAVIDFNDLTLAGDPRMDIASAVLFLGDAGEHREHLIESAENIYGGDIKRAIHFYRLYYSLVFASYCKESDPKTYTQSINSLKEHLSGSFQY